MPTRIHLFSTQPLPPPGECMALFRRFPELTLQASDILTIPIEQLPNHTDPRSPDHPDAARLFIVHAFTFLAHVVDNGRLPHFVAGNSTGELAAFFAAGVLDFSTGLRIAHHHGRLLRDSSSRSTVAPSLSQFLDPLEFSPPRIPVVSLVTVRPHEPAVIKQNLVRQLTQPLQWTDTLHWLLNLPSAEPTVMGSNPLLERQMDSLRNPSRHPETFNGPTRNYPA